MNIYRVTKDSRVPVRPARNGDGGIDMCMHHDIDAGFNLRPGETISVLSDIYVEANESFMGYLIIPRSSYSKQGLVSQSLIDSGFTGQVSLILTNTSTIDIWLSPNVRLTQLIPFRQGLEYTEGIDREDGEGFGSTGDFNTDELVYDAYNEEYLKLLKDLKDIRKARGKAYGNFNDSLTNYGELMHGAGFNDSDYSGFLASILLKVSRLNLDTLHNNIDTLVDLANYSLFLAAKLSVDNVARA